MTEKTETRLAYRQLLMGMITLFVVIALGRFAYTPIMPYMQAATHLGDKDAGLLATFNYLGYLIGAIIPMFCLIRSKVFDLKLYLLLNVITMFLLGITTEFWMWSILRLLNGIASGVGFVLASNVALEALRRAGKHAICGLLYSAVGAGIFTSSIFVFFYTDTHNWDMTWMILGGVSFALACIVMVMLKEPPRMTHTENITTHTQRRKYPRAYYITYYLAYFSEGAGYIVTGTFLVALIKAIPELEPYAPLSWMFVGLGAIPSTVMWSIIGEKIGNGRATQMCFVIQVIAVLMPILTTNMIALMISSMLFGSTFLGLTTLFMSQGQKIAYEIGNGHVVSLMTFIYSFGQMMAPYVAGVILAHTVGYSTALIFASIILTMGLISHIISQRYVHQYQ
ncbi:MFS transporter [Staphylococcus agnetis]|uniref:YbfB/YjiJ family MFS transporter n=1 Tax=Staphylococcus agnetis TaxID=985762 RepID=UPI000D19DD0D|nr:YbfB/YjiJ family MFS transporter [Staphylococcus agnetis]MCO4325733.1 YbfB/YjiJ family MFS transporter [Staphylococcus agnetis]MCO4356568.1 YbfB/YjiJ family MFS transporter [Staphylococcus agnetis]MCO4362753.1 YbfB/YjiJ family MFS transporter [Staphylococcus agnetis]MCO4369909.1 YbfB/YjiJ family MFS transporter [Staphylococcus agnetis]PTH69608.1 MFS transporter [Staphylococcus agnetis]